MVRLFTLWSSAKIQKVPLVIRHGSADACQLPNSARRERIQHDNQAQRQEERDECVVVVVVYHIILEQKRNRESHQSIWFQSIISRHLSLSPPDGWTKHTSHHNGLCVASITTQIDRIGFQCYRRLECIQQPHPLAYRLEPLLHTHTKIAQTVCCWLSTPNIKWFSTILCSLSSCDFHFIGHAPARLGALTWL